MAAYLCRFLAIVARFGKFSVQRLKTATSGLVHAKNSRWRESRLGKPFLFLRATCNVQKLHDESVRTSRAGRSLFRAGFQGPPVDRTQRDVGVASQQASLDRALCKRR